MSTRPLADEIRPQSLDEVVGQRHLIGPGGVLRRLIDAGTSANMIFYGPSGNHHVAIYLGDGMMLEAPNSGSTVQKAPVRWSGMSPYAVRLI